MYWITGSGRIELNITKKQAGIGSHPGDCESDVNYLRQLPSIRRQLEKLSPELVAEELKEYGAWDNEELADHNQNLTRLLWVACCDIVEGQHS